MIILMKDELGGKFIIESVGLIPETFCYLMDDGKSEKKC